MSVEVEADVSGDMSFEGVLLLLMKAHSTEIERVQKNTLDKEHEISNLRRRLATAETHLRIEQEQAQEMQSRMQKLIQQNGELSSNVQMLNMNISQLNQQTNDLSDACQEWRRKCLKTQSKYYSVCRELKQKKDEIKLFNVYKGKSHKSLKRSHVVESPNNDPVDQDNQPQQARRLRFKEPAATVVYDGNKTSVDEDAHEEPSSPILSYNKRKCIVSPLALPASVVITEESSTATVSKAQFTEPLPIQSKTVDPINRSSNSPGFPKELPLCIMGSESNPIDVTSSKDKNVTKYVASIRSKKERERLDPSDCDECSKFYKATGRPHLQSSRHRHLFAPPADPPNFWGLVIPPDPPSLEIAASLTEELRF